MATHKQAPRPDTDVFVDPVSPIYERLVDQIMANIAGHFDVTDATTGSVDWKLAKLAEVGALNKKNLETILRAMPEATRMTMDALEQSVLASLEVLEPSFASAVKEGYLQNSEYPMMSPRVRDVLTAYQQQARNVMNLVNTTMLDSATAAYQKVIAGTVSRVNAALSSEQTAKVLQMLNLKAGEVATGITSRRDALRQSLKELSDSGITGFVDKAGKTWNADTYINMNLRTTSGNVAMQATFARNADYGNDLIWWPILANARPGCYPWQGKVCSTSNRSGTTTDLNDNTITIYPLNQTTFGEPAGIGGINCHHKPPNIFIPGLSAIRGEVPPKKENAEGYENTQTQRALERKVRSARRDQAMAEASNDPVAAADAEKRSKQAVKELSAFTKENGLTFRRDRIATQGTTAPVKRPTTAKASTAKPAQEASEPVKKQAPATRKPSFTEIIERSDAGLSTFEAPHLKSAMDKPARGASGIPRTPAAPKQVSRATLEKKTEKIYVEMNKGELGVEEATRRTRLLMPGNSDAELRKYINRYGKKYGVSPVTNKPASATKARKAAPKAPPAKPLEKPKPVQVVQPKPVAASAPKAVKATAQKPALSIPAPTKKPSYSAPVKQYDSKDIDPRYIEPVNPVTSQTKKDALAYDFATSGYAGRPIVAIEQGNNGYQALTGSHRIYAARDAGIEIPTHIADISSRASAEFANAHDDQERLAVAEKLFKKKQIDKQTLDLLRVEEAESGRINAADRAIEKAGKWRTMQAEKAAKDAADAIAYQIEKDALEKAAREAAAAANTPMIAWEKRMAEKHGSTNFWPSLDAGDWEDYYKVGK